MKQIIVLLILEATYTDGSGLTMYLMLTTCPEVITRTWTSVTDDCDNTTTLVTQTINVDRYDRSYIRL